MSKKTGGSKHKVHETRRFFVVKRINFDRLKRGDIMVSPDWHDGFHVVEGKASNGMLEARHAERINQALGLQREVEAEDRDRGTVRTAMSYGDGERYDDEVEFEDEEDSEYEPGDDDA